MHLTPLRVATPADVPALADVHVLAWRETYPGIMAPEVLNGLDPAERAAMWGQRIAGGGRVLLAEDAVGIAGFGDCGPRRDAPLPFAGEILAIYMLRRAQRHGVGRRLMAAMAEQLATAGLGSMALWVAAPNEPARRFYEALGGRVVGHRHGMKQGWPAEIAYGWDDLTALVKVQAGR